MNKPTILCVDDEPDNLDSLERLFRKKYHVLRATSGPEALSVLNTASQEITAIVTDQRMPGMTGVEFLQQTLNSHPQTMRMLLTGYTDLESVISAVNQGQIYRYLTKPWDPVDLMHTLDQAVDRYNMGQELHKKNRELTKAYDELKTLDQAKSHFMILVNHELKTPLTSILNFLALLSESRLDEEQTLFVDRIKQSSQRLHQLIDDVLILIRAETNQLQLDLKLQPLFAFDQALSSQTHELIKNKAQTLELDWITESAVFDQKYLKEVLNRLVHNASKFGYEQSKILATAKKTQDQLVITICNQGPPISDRVIDKIFNPFFIDENIMNHSTGLGLGLTLSQTLLHLMSSGLNIKNDSQQVCVSFSLPLSGK